MKRKNSTLFSFLSLLLCIVIAEADDWVSMQDFDLNLEEDEITNLPFKDDKQTVEDTKISSTIKTSKEQYTQTYLDRILSENYLVPPFLQNGVLECLGVSLLACVAITGYLGKKINCKRVVSWYSVAVPYFKSRFTNVKPTITACGWNYFEFFSTGAFFCDYCLIKLECIARQCLWRSMFSNVIQAKDSFHMELCLKSCEHFTILIGPRIKLRTLQGMHINFAETLYMHNVENLSRKLCCLTDSPEAVAHLIFPEMIELFNKEKNQIDFLLISDQIDSMRYPALSKEKLVIQFRSQFTDAESCLFLVMSVLKLASQGASFKLTDKAKDKVKASREVIEKKQLLKQEEERKELQEKKKAEKLEKKLQNLSPEEKRKLEEKQEKRAAKLRLAKIKIAKA